MSILHQDIVLRLNANYMRIGWATPKDAFIAMWGGVGGDKPPAVALDIHYDLDADGNPILEQMAWFDNLSWEEWLMVEPRKGIDKTIGTAKGIVRVPTVIMCPKFFDMPEK